MKETIEISDNNSLNEYRIFLILLTALSLFMICWFGPVTEYAGHDYYFNIGRFKVLIEALKSGTYPIYIDYEAIDGYGYFTKGFYPDLVLLPFAAIGILTGVNIAYQVMIFTMTFLCGLFMYKALYTVFGNTFVASISSLLYTFSAYHLFDWYNRSALGESISFTFLPIIFFGFYHIVKGDPKKWYLLTIGYSLLVYTHLLSTFLTTAILALLLLICAKSMLKEPKRIGYLLLAVVVTLPITSSYLLTLLEQMNSNTFYYNQQENITGQTKLDLIDLGWGMLSGIAYPAFKNLAGTGPVLIFLVVLRFFVKEKSQYLKIADICLFIGLICLIATSSLFPWGRLPLGFIQFPWRLFEYVVFFFAIAGGYYLYLILRTKKYRNIAVATIILFIVVTFVVNNNNYKQWQTRAKNEMPVWFTGVPDVENEYYLGGLEYLPEKVPSYRFLHQRGDSIRSTLSYAETSSLTKEKGITSFDVKIPQPDRLELPLVYYKGYKAEQNGKELFVEESDYGLVQITANESGIVKVFYAGTTIQKVSWYVSLISILLLCVYLYISRKKKNSIR